MSGSRVRIAPPLRCVSLAELAEHGHATWTCLRPADRIDYALPAHATPEVLDYLRPLSSTLSEAGGIARLHAGRVHGSGAVLSEDGSLLVRDVSGDHGNEAGRHWLIGYAGLRAPKTINGEVAVAAVNLGSGYAHWLLEELPRLLTLPKDVAEHLVVHADTAFARQALAIRGGNERVIPAKRRLHLSCAPLVVPNLIAKPGAPDGRAMALIETFTSSLGHRASRFGERLYFTREKAGRRRIVNEAQLWGTLESLRFEKVALEELAWEEQIAACRRAKIVVAPHGAGLANLAFCPAGTRIVELVNRSYYNPGYWRLAALRGLDYRVLVSSGDGPLREDRRANREDISADMAQLRAAVK